jgi:hypothetical protein
MNFCARGFMMKKHDKGSYLFAVLFFTLVNIGTLAWADESEYDEVSYDSLVSELTQINTSRSERQVSPFEDVRIHTGVSLVTAMTNVVLRDEKLTSINSGMQLSLGIDLFSKYWIAEGSLRSFDDYNSGKQTITLKEFDMKFLHSVPVSSYNIYGGLGLSARYLYLHNNETNAQNDYSTPASIVFLGFNKELGKSVSVGAECSRRATLISDTPDKTAYDLSLRMNAYF